MLNSKDQTMHYKMYKAKKRWLFAGLGVVMMSGVLLTSGGIVAHADGTQMATTGQMQGTPVANTNAATNNRGNLAPTPVPAPADPVSPTDAYQAYKDGGYKTAQTALDNTRAQVKTDAQNYTTQKQAYQAKLDQYQTDVNSKAPNYQTSDPATRNTLNTEYTGVKSDYDNLASEQTQLADTVGGANLTAKAAQDKFDRLYNNLPANVKNAGVEVADYNAQTTAKATEQVTGATTKAYQTALNNQTGNLTTVLNDVTGPNDATGLATKETAKILVSTDSNQDGSVTATLYGKTYPDRNGDNKITYEDDILPVIKANLQSDLNPQNNQTDLKGSYGEIVALFNYMKQVADTAIPYQNADGTQGRIESANANSFSNVLNPNGSNMARNFGSDYATSLLTSIEDTKATLQAALKKIDDETGNTFDEAAFNKTFDDKLKAESIDIYTNQTNDMIQIAQNLLTAFKAASGDTIWKNSKAYTSPNTLVGTLTTAITAAQKNSTEGLAVLKNLAPSDNFLSTAYSKGDKDHGFTQTINSIWTDLYGTIDWFGTTISPLMKTDVTKAYLDDSNKPATAKDAAGNVIYSPDFIKAHDTVFNAATTLTNSVTKLMQQSAVISNDYGKVLNQLLTITDDYDYLTKSTLQPISNKGFSDQLTAPKPVQILAVQSTTPDSANQYQVQYVTTTGQSVGTGTFVGNPGDKVNAKVPDGYVLVPGEPGDQTVDNGKTVTFKVVPNSGTGEKTTPDKGQATVVPGDDNDGQPAERNAVGPDISQDTNITGNNDQDGKPSQTTSEGQTAKTDQTTNSGANGTAIRAGQAVNGGTTTQAGRAVSEGTATQNGQVVNDKTATQASQAASVIETGVKASGQKATITQSKLPQTNETNESAAAGLGVLGLITMLLSALGLKQRKRN